MHSNRIKEKGRRSLTTVAYIVTILWIAALLIPFVWMISSSLKDNYAIRDYPPSWIPKQPQTITLHYQYDEPLDDVQAYELDAYMATWFTWKKLRNEPVGEVIVYGMQGDRQLYRSVTRSYQYKAGESEIIPSQQFTQAQMERKLPLVREKGYSRFDWLSEQAKVAAVSKGQLKAATLGDKAAAFLESSDFMQGRLEAVSQKGDWRRLLDPYRALWEQSNTNVGFHIYLSNSMFVTGMSIVLQLLIGGMAGYALSRLISAKWSRRLLLFFVATIMIPEIAILIPLYLLIEKIGMVNSLWGIILPHTAWGIVIYLFKGFFDQLPGELLQAARIDGAREWRIFRSIVVPMSLPIFTVVAVMSFIAVWNELLWPMVVARQESAWTFTVALNEMQKRPGIEMNMLMASMVISTVPLLIIFTTCQKLIEKAVSWGGVKG